MKVNQEVKSWAKREGINTNSNVIRFSLIVIGAIAVVSISFTLICKIIAL